MRLLHGDPNQETRFSDDPLATAQRWVDEGTRWLHVVNLDGALIGKGVPNLAALQAILNEVDVSVQFGGGLRSLADAQRVLDMGVSRVIMGTAVVQNTDFAAEALDTFGAGRVVFALDARGGRVATYGWQDVSDWTPVALGRELAKMGAVHALYTDITRDGDMSGVNVTATAELARKTGLSVIASGGVSSLDDVVALRDSGAGIAGVVIGKALYLGAFQLSHAIKLAGG